MTRDFVEDVFTYLRLTYPSNYEIWVTNAEHFEEVSVCIGTSDDNNKILSKKQLEYIYELYEKCKYINERHQFEWQKELIDMIEGS